MSLLKQQAREYKEKNERSIRWIAEKAGIPARTLQRYFQTDEYKMNEEYTRKLKEFLANKQ